MILGDMRALHQTMGVQTWDEATPKYRNLTCGGGCLKKHGKANEATRKVNIDGLWTYICEECAVDLAEMLTSDTFKLGLEPEEPAWHDCGSHTLHAPHVWNGVAEWFRCGGVS